jgi:hypothetical protein
MAEHHTPSRAWRWTAAALVMAAVAVLVGLIWQQEDRAQRQFDTDALTITSALAMTVPPAVRRVHTSFLAACASNASFLEFRKGNPAPDVFSGPEAFVDHAGSGQGAAHGGYLQPGFVTWDIVLSTPQATDDFSQLPIRCTSAKVSVTIRCARAAALVPQPPVIAIIDHAAPENAPLIAALGRALHDHGLAYPLEASSSP